MYPIGLAANIAAVPTVAYETDYARMVRADPQYQAERFRLPLVLTPV